jgi:hypothetical protein
MSTINELSRVLGATARSNKYRVSFTYPTGFQGATDLQSVDVLAKAATAPTRELGQIELWNQGRKLIVPGDTVFDNAWSVDFYLTEDHQLRYDLIQWMDACDNFQKNMHSGDVTQIYAELRLEQLDSAGNPTAQYTLHNAFPQTIGEISYGADSADTPAEFNVIFAYSDFVTGTGEFNSPTPNPATENPTGL